jgi:hypothetical protein
LPFPVSTLLILQRRHSSGRSENEHPPASRKSRGSSLLLYLRRQPRPLGLLIHKLPLGSRACRESSSGPWVMPRNMYHLGNRPGYNHRRS